MTVRSLDHGRKTEYETVNDFMAELRRREKLKHPERFSPTGEPLFPRYPGKDFHERLASWHLAHPEAVR